jgi:hypothetical protein
MERIPMNKSSESNDPRLLRDITHGTTELYNMLSQKIFKN